MDFGPEIAAGRRLVLNIFPSVDTSVCATSVRRFNELASGLPDTLVLCVSADLPMAASRFCAAEGLANVVTGSTFRSTFGADYGLTLVDGPMRGLLSRAVIVADAEGTIRHTEQVANISTEPTTTQRWPPWPEPELRPLGASSRGCQPPVRTGCRGWRCGSPGWPEVRSPEAATRPRPSGSCRSG